MTGKLIIKNGPTVEGNVFGYEHSIAGEVVFSTGMTGYPQAFTDPSFAGQILVMTYPLLGNYGVPERELWESERPQIAGLIVSDYIETPSHFQSKLTLNAWLKNQKVPGLIMKDTRALTEFLRDKGSALGKIIVDSDVPFYDPNLDNLLAKVTKERIRVEGEGDKTILLIDCGAKNNIQRCFLKRGVKVISVPWDHDVFSDTSLKFDALFISNGPGDPKIADKVIQTIKISLDKKIPTLGICLGHQLLALAAGGDTYKLKYGHRSQNQPCMLQDSQRCYITTQNHGFAVGKIPPGFDAWFTNANDQTNEGIKHKTLPFMSVQFHPEATPGPVDTEWIFDYFLEVVYGKKQN